MFTTRISRIVNYCTLYSILFLILFTTSNSNAKQYVSNLDLDNWQYLTHDFTPPVNSVLESIVKHVVPFDFDGQSYLNDYWEIGLFLDNFNNPENPKKVTMVGVVTCDQFGNFLVTEIYMDNSSTPDIIEGAQYGDTIYFVARNTINSDVYIMYYANPFGGGGWGSIPAPEDTRDNNYAFFILEPIMPPTDYAGMKLGEKIVDPEPGDINADDKVDFDDLNTLANNWQKNNADWSQGDFNGDHNINLIDFSKLAHNWLKTFGSIY